MCQHPETGVPALVRSVAALAALVLLVLSPTPARALPAGFQEQEIVGPWNGASGLEWDAAGRLYVVERGGRVWLVENGQRLATPFMDLSSEVGGWRDYGLLGFALHPNFAQNHYVFTYYVVDHYDLVRCNAARDNPSCQPPAYNPAADEYFMPTIGRITRYTADPATGFRTVLPASRQVLLGETISTGFPILHQSHGTGQLVFGEDGTLMATCGDAASYNVVDVGSHPDTYFQQALNEGILRPDENIGALRAQYLGSLDGKMVRLDPETGDGVASNPFFEPANPRSAQSRTWALGLRNPYRFVRRPGTGAHHPADANPGTFYLGDVGWGSAEDLHVISQPGQNLGWPHFEGMTAHGNYSTANVANRLAPNPLFGVNGCAQEFLHFKNLIVQERADGVGAWPNPCNPAVQIPDEWTDGAGRTWHYAKFMHTRPPIDWRGTARVATFDGAGNATTTGVGAAGGPVQGAQFSGNASTGGVWYTRNDFPAGWRNTYFHADFGGGWIKSFVFDAQNRPSLVQNFVDPGNAVVFIGTSPTADGLYYVKWGDRVRRVVYNPGNRPPAAAATPRVSYGASPLAVDFVDASTDPDGQALTYRWDFGDGTTSLEANPRHVFTAVGPQRFDVRLTVTDSAGATADATLTVSVNNTPPEVRILSPREGQEYPLDRQVSLAARADLRDAEHGPEALHCVWRTSLHHDNHAHSEPAIETCEADIVVTPAGCDGHDFFYRVSLTVTDDAGLETTRSVDLRPDCENDAPRTSPDFAAVDRGGVAELDVLDNDWDVDGAVDPATVAIVAQPEHGGVNVDPVTGVLSYFHDASRNDSDRFTYVVEDDRGAVSGETDVRLTARVFPFVTIESPQPGEVLTEQQFRLVWAQDYVNAQPAVAVFIDGERVYSQAAAEDTSSTLLDTPPRGLHQLEVALVDADGAGNGLSVGTVSFEVVPGPQWDEDHDGVPDLQDASPLEPFACRDADADTCDDCASGQDASDDDGVDLDLDGLCDAGDFNGCDAANGGCDARTTCTATPGGRVCGACPGGFAGDGEQGCVDVDECRTDHGGCDANARCTNTVGSRTCTCQPWYVGDGLTCRSLTVSASAGPGLKRVIRDDAYRGALAGMTCVPVDLAPVRFGEATWESIGAAPVVTVAASHTHIGDLVMKLVSPSGVLVPLMSRPGAAEALDKGGDLPAGDDSDLSASAPVRFADGSPTFAEQMGAGLGAGQAVCRDDRRCAYATSPGAAAGLPKLIGLVGRPGAGRWQVCVGDAGPGRVGYVDRVTVQVRLTR